MFVGCDVAKALGYAKPQNALATHVDEEDKTTYPIQGTLPIRETAYETRDFFVIWYMMERISKNSNLFVFLRTYSYLCNQNS